MVVTSWLKSVPAALLRPRAGPHRRHASWTPHLERLEERQVPTTFLVTTVADSGTGSLRQAILDANSTPNVGGPDRIEFNIPGQGVHTIQPITYLPNITDPVVIDGYTQPGAQPNTLASGDNATLKIVLDGRYLSASPGLVVNTNNSTVRGLAISHFGADGILVQGGSGNTIAGNFIGTNVRGTTQAGNKGAGVSLNNAAGNIVGGTTPAARNLIAGNYARDVWIQGNGASGNVVEGNLLGLNASGSAMIVPDATYDYYYFYFAVQIDNAPNNVIGGTAAGAGNVIARRGGGVQINSSEALGNSVQGNSIGTDITGTVSLQTQSAGVTIFGAPDNTIGGTVAPARNLISGNSTGIVLTGMGATANAIQGNYVGTDVTGTAGLPNIDGVDIGSGASANTIGGTAVGACNLISGNGGDGVFISALDTTGNVVQGNLIGTDRTGKLALGNGSMGVYISDAVGNTLGGTAPGAGNLISGNAQCGVDLYGAADNVVQGNTIGTDLTGTAPLGNAGAGVVLTYGATGNLIGGLEAGARNLISGNQGDGVQISYGYDTGEGIIVTTANLVKGNYIGTDASGTQALGNAGAGVLIKDGAAENTIGGDVVGAANVISANRTDGVRISGGQGWDEGRGLATTANLVQGNAIGTDVTGTQALGNGETGVLVTDGAIGNVIGGTEAGARNLISGNQGDGVQISGISSNGGTFVPTPTGSGSPPQYSDGTTANLVEGNYIGTDATGAEAVPNAGQGVLITSSGNTLGGPDPGAGNLISGNAGNGVILEGSAASGNVVQGNYIGTDAYGTRPLVSDATGPHGNHDVGLIVHNAANNLISDNLVSGNGSHGILLRGSGATGNRVEGNLAGTDSTGELAVGNLLDALEIDTGASNNTIGGTTDAQRNVFSGNLRAGIVFGGGASANVIEGNYIGTDATGTQLLGNAAEGVAITDGSTNNLIGGLTAEARNLISGNDIGVVLQDYGTTGNVVEGNYIGTDKTGSKALGNVEAGVDFDASASANTVGGTTDGARNLISGNQGAGVGIYDGSTANVLAGNFIGPDVSGTGALGNGGSGVTIENASDNTVGGTESGAANVIAFNSAAGVAVQGNGGPGDVILGNSIFVNGGLGIETWRHTFPVLTAATLYGSSVLIRGTFHSTPNTSFRIEFFANDVADPSGYGEGQRFLGATTATSDPSGNASFTFLTPTQPGQFITATATVERLSWFSPGIPPVVSYSDTSEFSGTIKALPPALPTVSFASPAQSITENAVPGTVTITVQLEHSSNYAVSVPFTVSGTATSPADYTLSSGPIVIPAGFTTGTLLLTVNDDALKEGDETVVIVLDTPDNATLGAITQHTVTILDNDNEAPTAAFSNSGPIAEGSPVIVSFSNAFDVAPADTQAGFHYSIALGSSALATSYAGASDTASKLFAFNDNGTYTVYGRIFDRDGGSADYTTQVQVNNVPPTATLTNNGPIAEGNTATVTFTAQTDPSTADTQAGFHYSFALSPEDLATHYAEAATASGASFRFPDSSSYTVYARIFDKDGGSTDYSTTILVRNLPPTATLTNNGPVEEGSTAIVTFSDQTDPSPADTQAGFRYAYDFNNDGTFEIGDGTYPGSVASASVSVPVDFLIASEVTTVRARILDQEGGFTDYLTSIAVHKAPPPPAEHAQAPATTAVLATTAPGALLGAQLTNSAALPSMFVQAGTDMVVASSLVPAPFIGFAGAPLPDPEVAGVAALLPAEALSPAAEVNALLLRASIAAALAGVGDEGNTEQRTATATATRLLWAALDGDDSVRLVEDLLRGCQRSPAIEVIQGTAPTPAAPGSAVAPAQRPAVESPAADHGLEPGFLWWLIVPAAAVLTAAGWLLHRAGRQHHESTPATPSKAGRAPAWRFRIFPFLRRHGQS